MQRLSVVCCAAAGLLVGCAGPCEDDGFGQNCTQVPVVTGTATTGDVTPAPSTSSGTASGTMSASGESGSDASTDGPDPTGSTGPGGSTQWCADADGDGFGDPNDCTDVPDGDDPAPNTVDNADDCDDAANDTFPGAATEKDAGACTKDSDGDGFGDEAPPAGVDPGTDCDDDSDITFPGAAENEAELCAIDEDQDGYGSADPPAGVDAGTDCIDDNDDAFPGAAPLDDPPGACMEDVDGDDYGDSNPPAGAIAGTDCDDDDTDVPETFACLVWCNDVDVDQYGDPADCVFDVAAPAGFVGNDTDCDDNNQYAFPGSSPNDDAIACMEDFDGDDYGDATPPAGVDAGTDCDDDDALLTDQCVPCTPMALACNADDDLTQCNDNGTFFDVIEDCLYGCDDVGTACWPQLTVDAQAEGAQCFDTTSGNTVNLTANAAGGDGNYTYAWSPAATLDDATSGTPVASPTEYTVYTVDAGDGEGNMASDSVPVHVTDVFRDLLGPGCQDFVYPSPFGGAPVEPVLGFFTGDAVMCNAEAASRPHAYVCPAEHSDAVVTWEMQVTSTSDDDVIGFVWGWQNAAQFYVLSWKQTTQFSVFGLWEEGITVKRVDAPDQGSVSATDLFADFTTADAAVLENPASFSDQGWTDNLEYRVTLTLDGSNYTIDIDELVSGADVAETTITDASYPSGAVGFLDASQVGACAGFLQSSCL